MVKIARQLGPGFMWTFEYLGAPIFPKILLCVAQVLIKNPMGVYRGPGKCRSIFLGALFWCLSLARYRVMVSENRGRSAAMAIKTDIFPFILYRDLGRRRLPRFGMKNARSMITLSFVHPLSDNIILVHHSAQNHHPEISRANCSLACAGQEWRGGPQRNQCGAEQGRLLGPDVLHREQL